MTATRWGGRKPIEKYDHGLKSLWYFLVDVFGFVGGGNPKATAEVPHDEGAGLMAERRGRTALADDERPTKKRLPDDVRELHPELESPRWIESLKHEVETQFRDRNRAIAELRDLRFMRHKVHIPDAYQDLNPSGAAKSYSLGKAIESAVGSLASQDPRVHMPLPPRPTKIEQQNASATERFLQA